MMHSRRILPANNDTAAKLNKWIKYVLLRLVVKVGDRVQQQVIGLPMGTSCSPFMAKLELVMYELQYRTEQVSLSSGYGGVIEDGVQYINRQSWMC